MTTYIAPPFIWAIAALILIYLAVVGYFMNYLKRAHREIWLGLGSPSIILNNSIGNGFLTLRFLFSGKYKTLNDPKLAYLVWGIRALLFLCLGLMWIAKSEGIGRP
jgi:hypothetical protein